MWLKLISHAHRIAGHHGGPAIISWQGEILTSAHLEELLHFHLIQLLDDREMFPLEIKTDDYICNILLVYRSLRRASNTRALNQGVSSNDIDIINRCKTV